ncbi:MAG: T9SS C-terminal target domain-containing protein [Flavobacteriales bacterium]|nr:T9SS C-terminal target domain-containing protein [Flavobacteriales bacterium]MBL0045765.1 T9SS C-terminal target domain-containing protein [Flavobacteriales bacterium]
MNPFSNRSLLALMLGSTLLFTACKKDEDETPTPTPTPTDDRVRVEVDITSNTTWTADNQYLLIGFINVQSGAVLTIEPGTVIFGDKVSKGTLIINRGARLEAAGTAAQPIIFTSAQAAGSRNPGDWGGVIICGRSTINLPGGTGVVEGGVEAVFGGTDPADNSGTLTYVRIEFPGIAFIDNNEINGLTLAGVGNTTTINHVQVSYSGDDSYEWFGGSVNAKHLVAYSGWDDDFDMDNGFSGKLQFGVSLRDPNIADQSGSNGLEHDNDATGTTASPFTTPVLSNISIFGPQKDPATVIASNYRRATHLRRNTHTRLFNSVFAGYPTGCYIDGSACETNCNNGDLKVKNCVYSAMTTPLATASGSTWDIASWFTAGGNLSYTQNSELGVVDGFNLSAPNFTLTGASPLNTGASFGDSDLSDPFFTNVTFKGAFGSENWTSGWCNWDPQNTAY